MTTTNSNAQYSSPATAIYFILLKFGGRLTDFKEMGNNEFTLHFNVTNRFGMPGHYKIPLTPMEEKYKQNHYFIPAPGSSVKVKS